MENIPKYILLFIVFTVCHNCSLEKEKDSKEHISYNKISIKFKYDIGGENDKYQFGKIEEIKIDLSNNIYILDKQTEKISVYSGEDRIGVIGEEGRGPGEFIDLQDFDISNNILIALDQSLLKVSIFSTKTLSFMKAFTIDRIENTTDIGSKPWQIFALYDLNKLMALYRIPISPGTGDIERYKSLKIFDFNGKLDTTFDLKFPEDEYYIEDYGGSIKVMDLPFRRESIIRLNKKNKIFYGWTDSLYIESYPFNGEKQVIINKNMDKREVTNKDLTKKLSAYTSKIKNDFRNADIRNTWPVYEDFIISNNNKIWVITLPSNSNSKRVLILSPNGQIISELDIPANLFLQCVKNDTILGIERDITTGKEKVVVYHKN